MCGAIALAGMAAIRSGAGLTRVAVPDCCVETVAGFSPCLMVVPLTRQDSFGRICGSDNHFLQWLVNSDAIAVGPGLGRSAMLDLWVPRLISSIEPNSSKWVLDADALNALATREDWMKLLSPSVVITPHPGEWSRLSGVAASDRHGQRECAQEIAAECGCTIVLKGHKTLVVNGKQSFVNETGTAAMATGGSGDVLTGIIVALICQGLSPFQAARLGVHVHGLAGSIAQQKQHSHVVLPTELIEHLPEAFEQSQFN